MTPSLSASASSFTLTAGMGLDEIYEVNRFDFKAQLQDTSRYIEDEEANAAQSCIATDWPRACFA